MEFRVLGPLAASERGDRIALGGPRQRAVLAHLLLRANRVVPTERLIDEIWGDEPPEAARNALQSYVSRLRAALGDGARIEGRPPGYLLRAEPEELDVLRFDSLVREARGVAGDDPRAAAELLASALALWRGPALADLADELSLRGEIGRLEELRLTAIEERIAAELALGSHQDLVGELTALVEENPLRERLCAYLMLALYRSGRQAEALDVYRRARSTLVDQLGLEPSPELQRIQAQILRHDPALDDRPLVPTRNPYKGLRPFREVDAGDFFGREALTRRLVARLADGVRLLVLVGASGSGKSSVVRAGLVPALRREAVPGSSRWQLAELRPGSDPERRLGRVLSSADPTSELLLLVDPLEATFQLGSDDASARFLDALADAVRDSERRVRVVATLRADLYDRPLARPGLAELVREGTEAVVPLTTDELERAIEEPSAGVGVDVQPALVTAIAADVVGQPGALPLVQYALTELFERRTGSTLTLDDYRDIGGVAGALGRRAEALYGVAGDAGRHATRQVLLRLVSVDERGESARRRVPRSELDSLEAHLDAVGAVLDAFTRHRLVLVDRDPTTGEATVELAHEALLREWERLRGWVDEARDGMRAQRRLAVAAEDWERSSRDPGFLLRGSQLELAAAWQGHSELALAAREREFLAASLDARTREQLEERERQERELALERRSARRLRWLVAVLSAAALATAALTVFAFDQRGEARREAARAEEEATVAAVRELSAAANAARGDDPELAILLALQAAERSRAAGGNLLREAEEALHAALQSSRVVLSVPGLFGAAYSPDGRRLATSDDTGAVSIWDAASGRELRTLRPHGEQVVAIEFTPDGRRVVTTSLDGTSKLSHVSTGRTLHTYRGHTDGVLSMDVSPDGSLLVTRSFDGTARIWRLATGKHLRTLVHTSPLGVHFSPDGRRLAVGDAPGARVWEVATGREVLRIGRDVVDVRFSPDGEILATTLRNATTRLWNARTGEPLTTLAGHRSSVETVDFSPDGRLVATGSLDGTVRVWETRTGRQLLVLAGQGGAVEHLTFSPDGRLVVGAGTSGTTKVWDVTPTGSRDLLTLAGHDGIVFASVYRPDGGRLVTAGEDGHATVWDARTGRRVRVLSSRGGPIGDVAYSPDGGVLATAEGDGRVTLRDARSGRRLRVLEGHDGPVTGVAFSPDGGRVASVGVDATARVWDTASGEVVATLRGHRQLVFGVSFHPDGRRVATASQDETVKIWDVSSGEALLTLAGHTNNVIDVVFDPTGELLATASLDGTARVWEAETGTELHTLAAHSGAVFGVAFSPDGRRVATAGLDGTGRLWELPSGREILTLSGHIAGASSVAFSPDGRRLAVGGEDGSARIYAMHADELVSLAAGRVTRGLTSAECRQYLHRESCP